MEHPLVALGLLGFCVVLGGLLYLPFLLWFRYRKPRAGPLAAKVSYTKTGYALLSAQVLLMFGGLMVRDTDPASSVGRLLHGNGGMLKWWACIVVAFSVVHGLLRRAGVAIQRPTAAETSEAADGADASKPAQRQRGYHLLTLGGVSIFVHWSFLFAGVFLAAIASSGLEAMLAYCVAYAALLAIHEAGHAVVARAQGLRVHSVELSGIGGLCRVDVPRSVRQTWLVYAAGLLAQALLLASTLAVVAIWGPPQSPAGAAVATTFTWLNALVVVVNLIPGKSFDGLSTDGAVLWGLYLHVSRGAAHPLAALQAASPVFDPALSLLLQDGLVPAGFRTGIEMLNDDTTPMEFVVQMLEQHAGLDHEAAIAATVGIHQRGGLVLALPDRAAADAVADAIVRDARAQGHALVCRAVSASE